MTTNQTAHNGECLDCGRTFYLDDNGKVRRHGTVTSGPCTGSGRPPFKPGGTPLLSDLMARAFGGAK